MCIRDRRITIALEITGGIERRRAVIAPLDDVNGDARKDESRQSCHRSQAPRLGAYAYACERRSVAVVTVSEGMAQACAICPTNRHHCLLYTSDAADER